MRISTSQLYTQASASMLEGQSKLAETQAKLASGKNFTSLAEDPVGANQVVTLKRELSQIDMFQNNIDATRRRLELTDTTLRQYQTSMDRARTLILQSANSTLTDVDRRSISFEISEIVEELAGLMNTQDAKGEYLFSGSKGTERAYTFESGRYQFNGDLYNREIQIASGVYVDSTDSGARVFESIATDTAIGITGSLTESIVDYEITNPDLYQQLVQTEGDLQLQVFRVTPDPLDPTSTGLVYSIVDSSGVPLIDSTGNELSGIPYTDTETEVEVALAGLTLSLNLPLDADASTDDASLSITGVQKTVLSDFTVNDSALYAEFMLANGSLSIDSTYDELTGSYDWQVTNSDSPAAVLASGSYLQPGLGEITTGVEVNSAQFALTNGTFALSINGVESGPISLAANYADSGALTSALQTAIDADPLLTSAGVTVSYDAFEGLTFAAEDGNALINFVSPNDQVIAELGITSNQFDLSIAGMEVDLSLALPTAQEDYNEQLRFVPPEVADLRLEQPPTNPLNALLSIVEALRVPLEGEPDARLEFDAAIALALDQTLAAQSRVSESSSSLGARLNALDSAESSNTDFKLMTQGTLSAVEDLDYAAASTELAKRQLALQAAYSSFAKIQGLSLFNYIN